MGRGGSTKHWEEGEVVWQEREMEGGDVRGLLPPHHSTLGTFPRDIFSSKVGLGSCWDNLRLSVLMTQLLGEATAAGVDAMHELCEGQHHPRSFPGELQRHKRHYYLLQELLMILINM